MSPKVDKTGGKVRQSFSLPHAALMLFILVTVAACARPQTPPGMGRNTLAGEQGDRKRPLEPELLIRQFDLDGDGRLSRAEAPEGLRRDWDRIDIDRDGFVTLAELNAQRSLKGPAENRPDSGQPGFAAENRPPAAGGERNPARFQPGGAFSVVTVGTGTPQYNPARSGPAALLQYQGKYFLIDMGNGTQARLSELGISPRQLAALILTHHHLDHNEEFIPLFINTQLMGAAPEIIGTPQSRKLVDFITDFYAEDIAYRLARRGTAADAFRKVAVREVKGGENFNLGGMQVSTARVNHTIHTVAYRFEAEGRAIVISGDLSYSDSLVELAHEADVLVIDGGGATVRQSGADRAAPPGAGPQRPAAGSGDPFKAHAGLAEVAAMAQKAGVKRLVLTHIGPGEIDEEATIRALGETYKGEIIVGRDLLETVAAPPPPAPAAPAAPR